ncbi:MAG: antitoxin component YwqK of YwqJK toxin-antitoxin module/peroxiredoxin [Chlamydiales bacterium]|jgi:antitoxin component YwqK of YwqJK toxin-antitoxin module/peroxiredoxin
MRHLRIACLAGAALTSCAVVTAVTGQIDGLVSWVEGFSRGSGKVAGGLQQGEWIFYGDSGQKRAFGSYKDDVQDGPWVYLHPNGNKEYEGTFAHERRVGLWRYWHANGSPKAQGYFHEGREFGQWLFWDKRGQRTQRGHFQDGLQSHRWTYWHPDGSAQAEGWFLEGQKVGVWSFWDEAGAPSDRDFGLEDGLQVVSEEWSDGTVRREGLLRGSEKQGLWLVQHRSGQARLQAAFEQGVIAGPSVVFDANGDRLAAGVIAGGRPTGEWSVWSATGEGLWSASGESPSVPFVGEWSDASLADPADLGPALGRWLAEASSDLDPGSVLEAPLAVQDSVSEEQLAEVQNEPGVPVNVQPWTERQRAEAERFLEIFTNIDVDASELMSRYSRRAPGKSTEADPVGDLDRASDFVGKRLPLTEYIDPFGVAVDLESLRGQRVVLVVLKGFGGGVCIYCTEQTIALCDAGAFERFEELDARLMVLYPGSKEALAAFKRSCQSFGDTDLPPYGLLYQQDVIVGKKMGLEGDKVVPSTFILDEQGIVRFAYIGEHEADRPSVELLFKKLEETGPAY